MRAAAVARRAGGQARGRVPPEAAQDPGRAAHGKGGYGLAPTPAEEGRGHAGDGDDRVPAAARLRRRRLGQGGEEGGLAGRRPRALAAALAQPAHLRAGEKHESGSGARGAPVSRLGVSIGGRPRGLQGVDEPRGGKDRCGGWLAGRLARGCGGEPYAVVFFFLGMWVLGLCALFAKYKMLRAHGVV